LAPLKCFASYLDHKCEMQVDVDYISIVYPMLECGNCDLQLEILYCQMVVEAMKVLGPFLSFA
jgi:hypothetical protein